jgi:hypothetical protein
MTLDREPLRIPNWLFCLILAIVPFAIAMLGFSMEHGFLGLPRFGEVFRDRAMNPVKRYAPPARPNDVGYDGQFYAQIALDPTLRDPALSNACDILSYRAKRILLPAFAYALGAGQPWYVLQIYALLNLAFWFLLLTVLLLHFGVDTWSKRLLCIGILWNAGSLISIGRALTDLPALCLGIIAVCWQEKPTNKNSMSAYTQCGVRLMGSVVASLSVLTKETAILSLFSFLGSPIRRRWWQITVTIVIILAPIGLWTIYVHNTAGTDETSLGNFTYPLLGFANKLSDEWRKAFAEFPRLPLLELIAPWSIAVQVVWMIWKRSWRSPWWQFGAGFVCLAIMLGPWVWATQSAYSRCLLPMAVSFNVLLFQSSLSRKARGAWWVAGNLGFLDRAAIGIVLLGLIEMLFAYRDHRSAEQDFTERDHCDDNRQSR